MYHEEAIRRARTEGEQMKSMREEQEARASGKSRPLNLPPGL